MKQKAFVLKKIYSSPYKVALLDAVLGRIDASCLTIPLVAGALIEYHIPSSMQKRLDSIEVLFVPLHWGANDLGFIHHALELCYYFIPLNNHNTDVFEMLLLLTSSDAHTWDPATKRIFIAKLLILFSMYSKTTFVRTPFFEKLYCCTIENLLTLDRCSGAMAYIDLWIKQTINEHPMRTFFKTADFFTESK